MNRARRQGTFRQRFPQPTACEICGEKPATCLDHDHSNRDGRGWVCVGCNTLLASVDRNGVENRLAFWHREVVRLRRLISIAPRVQAYLDRAVERRGVPCV